MIKGQTTFITGAGSGLGAALAARFTREGAKVALVDVDLDRARHVADSLDPDLVLPLAADVRDPRALHDAVDATLAKFGALDTVIPNAGIWDYNRSITTLTGEELAEVFDEVMSINT
ncbi:MAG TPA: SDR family NAD(P)-dependent oxidoreductase, partial [Corynebacterium sp.]|nr:SDR family NAD(P)-dependent oxidoreductase [Corynebacterium sp.]